MLGNLSQYTLMSIVSGVIGPTVLILIRDKLINDFSMEQAGQWQSVARISDYYLSFITSILAIYYLPKLSSISDQKELRKEILNGYKIILPISASLTFLVWLLKKNIVLIIFNSKFLPSLPLYDFQLLGDFFKIASWMLAYLMLAKAKTKIFLLTEISFYVIYIFLSFVFTNNFGIIGITYGFCLSYFVYLVAMFLIFRKYFK
jgi:PST family polysaccharide transporter